MKITTYPLLAVMLLTLALSSCKNPPPPDPPEPEATTIILRINPMVNGQPFSMDEIYTAPDGIRYKYEVVKFYLNHLRLFSNSGTELALADVMLIDYMESGSNALQIETNPGTYDGIRFGLGLDAAQNSSDPSLYPADSPLSSLRGTYWTWNTMYRFVMLEGRTDSTGNSPLTGGFIYHTGLDSLYRTLEIEKSFTVAENQENVLELWFDLEKIFYGPVDTVDIIKDFISHTTDEFEVARKVTDNFVLSLQTEN